jgi:hypothetical protein
MSYNTEKWIKEVQKWKTPIDDKQLIKGRWSNVTRKQTVEVIEVSFSEWYQ